MASPQSIATSLVTPCASGVGVMRGGQGCPGAEDEVTVGPGVVACVPAAAVPAADEQPLAATTTTTAQRAHAPTRAISPPPADRPASVSWTRAVPGRFRWPPSRLPAPPLRHSPPL